MGKRRRAEMRRLSKLIRRQLVNDGLLVTWLSSTRKAGMDRETEKELLLKHLKSAVLMVLQCPRSTRCFQGRTAIISSGCLNNSAMTAGRP
jgi:hypothetical protein